MGNSVEYISYTCVPFNYCQERAESGGYCFPCSFKREATGAELTFHHSIIGNFMVDKI